MLEQKKQEPLSSPDILKLSNELLYQKYMMSREHIHSFFQDLNMADYVALHIVKEAESSDGTHTGRTYLKDLAQKMRMDIHQVSKMAGNLSDRGLVKWSHDGNGSEGTYLIPTEYGLNILERKEKILRDYYGKVIRTYGEENVIQLLTLMQRLETVMNEELENIEGEPTSQDG